MIYELRIRTVEAGALATWWRRRSWCRPPFVATIEILHRLASSLASSNEACFVSMAAITLSEQSGDIVRLSVADFVDNPLKTGLLGHLVRLAELSDEELELKGA